MTDPDNPRMAAAAAMRRLGHAMVAYETDDALLERIAHQAAATAEVVEAGTRRKRPVEALKRRLWEDPPDDGDRMAHFEECVVSGRANPMGIMMHVRRDDQSVVGSVNLGAAFEGAPRRAHGGIVAAILDDIMGYVLLVQRTPAFTGTLQVRYAAPIPVQADLVAKAWMVGRDGRKLTITGTLSTLDGTEVAHGDAVFIEIPPEWFSSSPADS